MINCIIVYSKNKYDNTDQYNHKLLQKAQKLFNKLQTNQNLSNYWLDKFQNFMNKYGHLDIGISMIQLFTKRLESANNIEILERVSLIVNNLLIYLNNNTCLGRSIILSGVSYAFNTINFNQDVPEKVIEFLQQLKNKISLFFYGHNSVKLIQLINYLYHIDRFSYYFQNQKQIDFEMLLSIINELNNISYNTLHADMTTSSISVDIAIIASKILDQIYNILNLPKEILQHQQKHIKQLMQQRQQEYEIANIDKYLNKTDISIDDTKHADTDDMTAIPPEIPEQPKITIQWPNKQPDQTSEQPSEAQPGIDEIQPEIPEIPETQPEIPEIPETQPGIDKTPEKYEQQNKTEIYGPGASSEQQNNEQPGQVTETNDQSNEQHETPTQKPSNPNNKNHRLDNKRKPKRNNKQRRRRGRRRKSGRKKRSGSVNRGPGSGKSRRN